MKRCADTWYLMRLAERDPRALRILQRVESGRDELTIPTITLSELLRLLSRKGKLPLLNPILDKLDKLPPVRFIPCDKEIALKAGELSSAYGLSTVDAVVAVSNEEVRSHGTTQLCWVGLPPPC